MNRSPLIKKLYISMCAVLGGKSSCRQGSFLAWNQPWTWTNRCMTICQHLTGDVRTKKWTKYIRGKGVVYQNNPLNIKLMYSRSFAHLFSKTVRLPLNANRLIRLKISLHYKEEHYMQLCSYTVIQFFLRGGVWKGMKEILLYNILYNNYIFSKKAIKIGKWAKNNCITA